MSLETPSPKNLVWPLGQGQIQISWDSDAPGGAGRWALPHTLHLPYEPLTSVRVAIDDKGVRYPVAEDVQPRLAIAWSPSSDYRTWTIRLREGVRSHAGNELTADDVKWSWDRVYALRGVGLWRSRRVAGVASSDDIEVLDRSTLRFHLLGPNPEFPQYLSFATNMVIDSTEARKHAGADDPWAKAWLAGNAAGYGAFSVVRQDGDALGFQARDDFWAGRPGIDTVLQVGVARREEALRLLERGEANIATHLYPEELRRFEGRPGYQVYRVRASHSLLSFNWREPPFDDPKVRQAVCLALPYQRIIDEVYLGDARPSRTLLTNTAKFATDKYWRYATDPGQARALLAASRSPDGFATELEAGSSGESRRFGAIVQEALREIGITVSLRPRQPGFGESLPPLRFREECGHALTEAMYDLMHDFDPPAGMRAGMDDRDRAWANRLKAIRAAGADDQPGLYDDIQRDLLEFAPAVPIAEIQTGWVIRDDVAPWALSAPSLAILTTVWGAHRGDLGSA